jgi:cell wall-associated NlpC family hydrolase
MTRVAHAATSVVLAVAIALVALAGLIVSGLQAASPAAYAATSLGISDIPHRYLSLYQRAAARCPGLAWPVLAGVGKVESDHGRGDLVSVTSAAGPMQFEPATWAAYGVDGDGDGTADPFDPADAIPAAADYLCSLGVAGNVHDALIAYNCGNPGPACQAVSAAYAAAVLEWAGRYGAAAPSVAAPTVEVAVRAALSQLGKPYVWAGETPAPGFDCSGLAQWAYAHAGVQLPRVAQAQYDAGPRLPAGTVPRRGDLVFFGAVTNVHHVGIYLGDGRMVDAPHTGAHVRTEPVAGFGHIAGYTRPLAPREGHL